MSGFAATAVIIPALNEAENLRTLLPQLTSLGLGQIIVCDNGSTDATRDTVQSSTAQWIYEPKRGYGAACQAGIRHLANSISIVAFLDADLSDDPGRLNDLVDPIAQDQCDLVIGNREPAIQQPGSTTFPQRFANRLFPALIRLGWGFHYTDMGPFRAVRRSALEAMRMKDHAYGWTIEMQIRAVELRLRIRETPIPYRKRRGGKSKISGNLLGIARAAYWITRTCGLMWLTKRRRMHPR